MKKISFIFFLIFVFCLTFALKAEFIDEGLWKFSLPKDFLEGTFNHIELITEKDQTVLQLLREDKKFLSEGEYISSSYQSEPFNRLILSWNASAPEGTLLKFQVQIFSGEKWSDWYTIAEWGPESQKRSFSEIVARIEGESISDDLARISIDTLIVKDPGLADKFRYKIKFYSTSKKVSPKVTLVAVKTFNNKKQVIKEVSSSNFQNVDLPVPMRSQMVENPDIARRICSPTSLAMVLEYYGINLPTAEVARAVYDHGAGIYGNWIFNTAFAGKLGLEAYVDHFDIFDLKEEIEKGHPVICSVRFKAGELDGAPIMGTSGHLLVVRGLKIKDGNIYVIVNDPAAPDNQTVRREYRIDQFINAWNGYVYIVHKKN